MPILRRGARAVTRGAWKPLPYDVRLRRYQELFLLEYGRDRYLQRVAEIAALPAVRWKGRLLFTLTCQADFGKGPHPLNVPETLLWQLISLENFRCPYH
jgi:hypothetical protein